MGYPTELFLTTPPDYLLCKKCKNVPKDACSMNDLDIFCSSCLETSSVYKTGLIDNIVMNLLVKPCNLCGYFREGMTLKNLLKHLSIDCLEKEVICSNYISSNNSYIDSNGNKILNDCKWVGKRRELQNHQVNFCEYTRIKCENKNILTDKICGNLIPRREYDKHVTESCPFSTRVCPKCNLAISKCDLSMHLFPTKPLSLVPNVICPKININCDCGESMTIDKLAEHANVCKIRLISCGKCGMLGTWLIDSKKEEHDWNECVKRYITCDKCRKEGIIAENIKLHLDKECPNYTFSCPFEKYACNRTKMNRGELCNHIREFAEKHEKMVESRYLPISSNIFHLHLSEEILDKWRNSAINDYNSGKDIFTITDIYENKFVLLNRIFIVKIVSPERVKYSQPEFILSSDTKLDSFKYEITQHLSKKKISTGTFINNSVKIELDISGEKKYYEKIDELFITIKLIKK